MSLSGAVREAREGDQACAVSSQTYHLVKSRFFFRFGLLTMLPSKDIETSPPFCDASYRLVHTSPGNFTR